MKDDNSLLFQVDIYEEVCLLHSPAVSMTRAKKIPESNVSIRGHPCFILETSGKTSFREG
jgi:hypothetical protein